MQFVNITSLVAEAVSSSGVADGMCIVYTPHTTAGITINENADPDVVKDMKNVLDKLIPWNGDYRHFEGNTAAHVKARMMGSSVQVIITTGGTGITGRDGTPEALQPLLDKSIDGFGEMFRSLSYQNIGTSTLQSRALAGVANSTYIFALPGSGGACRDGWDLLISHQLDYRTKPCNLVELLPRLNEN